jgi:hypothetical protein
MSLRNPHMLNLRHPGLPPEEVDTLLRSFFRAEMPDPWPVLKAPVEEPFRQERQPASRWTALRSRAALAASVALLVLGSWCFSAKAPDYSLPPQDATTGSGSSHGSKDGLPGGVKAPSKTQAKPGCSGCSECCNPSK